MKDSYDVIIIGASIAGLECAKNLAKSGLSVLVIERDKVVGKKVCAGGIIPTDLKYIPKQLVNFDLQKVIIHYKNKTVSFPDEDGIISTIDRAELLDYKLNHLKNFNNIKILTGVSVSKIISRDSLEVSSGRKLRFNFLVGADGASSVVRKFLNVPIKKLEIAIQYLVPKRFPNFEVFLAGDAAGLTSGILGKGIHPAFLSGKQVAKDILGENTSSNLIKNWLRKKREQEKYMFFLKNPFLRKLFFSASITLLPFKKSQRKAIAMIE